MLDERGLGAVELGEDGGRLVASGTPEEVARHKTSVTAPYLRKVLSI